MKIKIAAILMLLSFGQGLGLPLLVHHYFHETSSNVKEHTATSNLKVNCNCFDDALMPMQMAEHVQLKPVPEVYILQNERYTRSFISREIAVFSLRGPPLATVNC